MTTCKHQRHLSCPHRGYHPLPPWMVKTRCFFGGEGTFHWTFLNIWLEDITDMQYAWLLMKTCVISQFWVSHWPWLYNFHYNRRPTKLQWAYCHDHSKGANKSQHITITYIYIYTTDIYIYIIIYIYIHVWCIDSITYMSHIMYTDW